MAKGIKIKFDNNDQIYEIYTSTNSESDYILYSDNIVADSIVISGTPLENASNVLYVKLVAGNNERIITITIEKPTVQVTPTLTSTPTLTKTSNIINLTPTRTSTPTLTKSSNVIPPIVPTATATPTLTATSIVLPTNQYLFVTSYNEYTDNNFTTKYFTSLTSLYNTILTESNTFSAIYETVRMDNGISIGSKVYNLSNEWFNINGYMGYYDNNIPKYIRIVNGIISEIGNLIVQTTSVSGSKILFPYYTKDNSNNTGWGYLANEGYWIHRLNIANDGLTLIYSLFSGDKDNELANNGGYFSYYYDNNEYLIRPYYTLNRLNKVYGLPNGFKIPDMYRNSVIELIISVDVDSRNQLPDTEQNRLIKQNIITTFNASFNIYIGK